MVTDYHWRGAFSRILKGLFLSTFVFIKFSSAAYLQIIHTNDLHSHFEHGEKPKTGHYAAVKYMIDTLKYAAWDKGLETLVVDAGDFSEGSQFFLADRGVQSWKALNELGYDAVVLGNHDYLTGQADLSRMIQESRPDFFLLGANFKANKKYIDLYNTLKPRVRLERNADWISVMGLTTDEYMYTWRVGKGTISSPIATAKSVVPKYRKDSDFVFAVTHLGTDADRKLVRETSGIDLVIGGHSHSKLFEPIIEYSKTKQPVPIVQAGQFGEYVGDLLVELIPGKPVKVLRYVLHPINLEGPKDARVLDFVKNARKRLEKTYPVDYLTKPIGYSFQPMVPPSGGHSVWGEVLGEGMRRLTKSHIAINAADLFGDDIPAGAVTREKLFQFYPRVFQFFNFTTGWSVWTLKVEGWILKYFLRDAVRQGFDISVTGATYTKTGSKGNEEVSNLKVAGKGVSFLGMYKIAMPEGIARVIANDYYNSRLVDEITDTHIPMWATMELQFNKQGGFIFW